MAGQNQQKPKSENHFEKFTETMKSFAGDRDAYLHAHQKHMESHKKNIETLTEANKMALEVMRNVAELQQQYIKQAFESFSGMMKESMQNGVNQDSWKKHTEQLKDHMNRSVDHGTTVANMLSKSHKEVYEKMKGRVADHMQELKQTAQKTKH